MKGTFVQVWKEPIPPDVEQPTKVFNLKGDTRIVDGYLVYEFSYKGNAFLIHVDKKDLK